MYIPTENILSYLVVTKCLNNLRNVKQNGILETVK